MDQYKATIQWQRNDQAFTDNHFSRAHTWHFDEGVEVPGSSSPHMLPVPYSVAAAVDPEEAFVAALSSCHMLFFLMIAAKRGFCIDSYIDEAVGVLEKNAIGKLAMTSVTLRPKAIFSGDLVPTDEEVEAMHSKSHEKCFIASSVTTEVHCCPVFTA
ncbi:MAG: peroxiredoxin [Deltaproteobacteria bacterium RIFCSPLOWO2_02_FULL_53_8]|nr:MAG: peroxiredoxin [Deltaproteobacteria bacterium RIFCSPLOWO2_02_FULL_53_8]